jgi:uncharacterized protein YjbJ (UPF0337 family)
MDWDEIERNWTGLKGEVKHEWSNLTDEDVELVKGKYAELLCLLQKRYGHAKEQAEQEINDWAKRIKVDIVAELTALRHDVAGLSASVGDLVRRQAAVTAGLDHPLAAAKLKLEEKVDEAVDHIKGAVVRMSVVAALAVAAAIFALLAFITGACGALRVAGARLWSISGAWYRWRSPGCDRAGLDRCRDNCRPRENKLAAPLRSRGGRWKFCC